MEMNLWFLKAGIIGEGVEGRRVRKIEDGASGRRGRKKERLSEVGEKRSWVKEDAGDRKMKQIMKRWNDGEIDIET